MVRSYFTNIKKIPTKVATGKSSPSTTNFANGISTYKPNDMMGDSELRLAQDARFDRIGEYKTRRGLKKLTNPIGEAGPITYTYELLPISSAEAVTFTLAGDFTGYGLSRVGIYIKRTGDTYAVPRIRVYRGDDLIGESFLNPDEITQTLTFQYCTFIEAPAIATETTGATIRIEIGTQGDKPSDFEVGVDANHKLAAQLLYAPFGAITNVFEANIDGAKSVLYTFNNKLYRYDGTNNSLLYTLPTGVTKVRFNQDLNEIRFVDGKEGPKKIDPANSWGVTAITTTDLETGTDLQIKVSNIMDGISDNMVYMDADTNTQAVWTFPYGYAYAPAVIYTTTYALDPTIGSEAGVFKSTLTPLTSKAPENIELGDRMYHGSTVGEVIAVYGTSVQVKTVDNTANPINSYDAFNRDFRQNFPAILTGDPLTAMFNLGGVYYFLTRRNKYQMYAQTADQWTQSQCTAQNGTFSQESVVCDLNYAYFANDSGIYRFNGVDEDSLTQATIQNVYDAIPTKDSIVLDLYQNRLYVFYASEANGPNDRCFVYNINLQRWESFDTNTYVSATSARQNSSNRFICGHSKLPMLMLAETEDNDYSDMGSAINFNLETAYEHFGTPSQFKRIPKWRPEFATVNKPYAVQCGYALDYTDNVKYAFSVDLLNNRIVNESYVWDNPSDYGVPNMPTVLSTIPQINGEFYRCQLRYQHIAAFEPVTFRSHTVTVQTQRIR